MWVPTALLPRWPTPSLEADAVCLEQYAVPVQLLSYQSPPPSDRSVSTVTTSSDAGVHTPDLAGQELRRRSDAVVHETVLL